MTNNTPQHVRFLFDPACPWAWRASHWIRHAARVRSIAIHWGVLSLAYLNRDTVDDQMRSRAAARQPALRVLLHVQQHAGNDALDRLYWALGNAEHRHHQSLGEMSTLRDALLAAELDPNVIAAADNAAYDDQITAQSAGAQQAGAIGVPTLFINDNPAAYFGPVIDQVPDGEEAGELWDHVLWMADHPYLYELKRSRS